MLQRGHNFCIIDEVDSILIDEARTPLIISGVSDKTSDIYEKCDAVVRRMKAKVLKEMDDKAEIDDENVDYIVDEDTQMVQRIDHIDKKTKENLGKLYEMKLERTGNCFIAHPEEGFPADYWENSKKQNNEALINPLLGFDFNRELAEFDAKLDEYLMGNVNILTEQTLSKIDDCDSFEELYELVEAEEVGLGHTLTPENNPTIILEGIPDPVGVNLKKMTNKAYDTATGGGVDGSGAPIADTYGESPYTIYYNWLLTYGFVPAQ